MLINKLFKNIIRNFKANHFSTNIKNAIATQPPWKILFFGTDDFSLPSLIALYKQYSDKRLVEKLEVVTSLKPKKNVIEKFCNGKELKVHNWPLDCAVCEEFHVGIVVSFGHLIPKAIIEAFSLGILNVHASLLPRWRGAAPIMHAIANGDERTGITIMRIKPLHFDIGEIVSQSPIEIKYDTTMPELYNTLACLGAEMLIDILKDLSVNLNKSRPQPSDGVTLAPKFKTEMLLINWQTMSARTIYNLARASIGMLYLQTSFQNATVKLQQVMECDYRDIERVTPGLIIYNKNTKCLDVQCVDGCWISVKEIRLVGKKLMSATDFYNGFLSKYEQHLQVFR